MKNKVIFIIVCLLISVNIYSLKIPVKDSSRIKAFTKKIAKVIKSFDIIGDAYDLYKDLDKTYKNATELYNDGISLVIEATDWQEILDVLKDSEYYLKNNVWQDIIEGIIDLDVKYSSLKMEGDQEYKDNEIYKKRYWSEANISSTEKLMDIAGEAGLTILELAFKWCYANQKVTSIISGVSKLSQLEQNLKVIEGELLSKEVLEKCDKVWKEHTGNPFGYNR
jgi:hypothetical protein